MKPSKNKIILLVTFFLTFITSFALGFYISQDIFKKSADDQEAFNTFIRYEISRNIAISLKSGGFKKAQCQANLEASSSFDFLKACAKSKECFFYIKQDISDRTPEILSMDIPDRFDYLPQKDGIRRCQNQLK